MASGIKVISPASISLFSGVPDAVAVTTEIISDEMIGRVSPTPGIRILEITGPGKQDVPRNVEANTAGRALRDFFRYTGLHHAGIEIEIHKYVPAGMGLGSSDASASAAVILANALFGSPLSTHELLSLAVVGESAARQSYHAEQVAACMLGGIILVRDLSTLDILRLANPSGIILTIVRPVLPSINTRSHEPSSDLRSVKSLRLHTAHLAALVLALERYDLGLLDRALPDHLLAPERHRHLPGFSEVKHAAYQAGAVTIGIAGHGPVVYTISNNTLIAENAGEAMVRAFAGAGIDASWSISKINTQSAQLQ